MQDDRKMHHETFCNFTRNVINISLYVQADEGEAEEVAESADPGRSSIKQKGREGKEADGGRPYEIQRRQEKDRLVSEGWKKATPHRVLHPRIVDRNRSGPYNLHGKDNTSSNASISEKGEQNTVVGRCKEYITFEEIRKVARELEGLSHVDNRMHTQQI